jgi:hypothetical protein
MKKYFIIGITLSFSLVVVLMGLYTEFFYQGQSRSISSSQSKINRPDLKFNQFVVTNRHGNFTLFKKDQTWFVKSKKTDTQYYPLKNKIVEQIAQTFQNIEVKREYTNDDINKSHFSLDDPISVVKANAQGHPDIEIQFGVTNPINQSSYILHTHSSYILQVKNIPLAFFNHEMKDFIDHRVFNLTAQEIKRLKIIKVRNGSRKLLDIKRSPSGEQWLNNKNSTLALDKLQEYLSRLLNVQGHFLVHHANKGATEGNEDLDELKNNKRNLLLKIIFLDQKGDEHTYQVYNAANFKKSKKKKRRGEQNKTLLVTNSNNSFRFLVNREQLALFSITDRKFRELGISKLFY